jgi:hypothetical protein
MPDHRAAMRLRNAFLSLTLAKRKPKISGLQVKVFGKRGDFEQPVRFTVA